MGFLLQIKKSVPEDLELHLADHYCTLITPGPHLVGPAAPLSNARHAHLHRPVQLDRHNQLNPGDVAATLLAYLRVVALEQLQQGLGHVQQVAHAYLNHAC